MQLGFCRATCRVLEENLAMYNAAGVNTVFIPITWKSLEPAEDEYDYTMIDALIDGCRRHDLKLVVLWFGSIKNGQVGFAPRWFVDDRDRFFRAQMPDGSESFFISPFCQAAIEAFAHMPPKLKAQLEFGPTFDEQEEKLGGLKMVEIRWANK